MKKTGRIKDSDIYEFPFKDDEFASLLKYVRKQNFPIYETRSANTVFFKKADLMLWRPHDLYHFRRVEGARSQISQHDIFHPAMHHILVTTYGQKLKGRPIFTLLCEAIATSTEFYFMLKNIDHHGARMTEEESFREYVRGYAELTGCSAAKSRNAVQNRIEIALKNPYGAFQKCVVEGLSFYEEAFDIAANRGDVIDIKKTRRLCRPGEYRFVFTRYFWSININYCLAYCGHTSSREDQTLVKKCLKTLSDSKTFAHFLEKLGLFQERPAA